MTPGSYLILLIDAHNLCFDIRNAKSFDGDFEDVLKVQQSLMELAKEAADAAIRIGNTLHTLRHEVKKG